MTASIDITGERYTRLVALNRCQGKRKKVAWLFRCDCGNEVEKLLENVRSGVTKSCGCLRIDTTRERSLTHGHRVGRKTSATLKSYQHAKSRCTNPNDEKYPHYGGRGISMCARWMDNFENFLSDMGECPEGLSIDRIDVNKDYEPGNCEWANTHQQARHRRDNVIVFHEGKEFVLKDFAAYMGVSYKTLHAKIKYKGMTPHEAVSCLLR